MKLTDFFYRIRYFLTIWAISFTLGALLHLFIDFVEIHLFINHYYTNFFDFFFKYITLLGDGRMFIPLLIFALFTKYRDAVNWTIFILISTIIGQTLKRTLGFPRPYHYFTELLPSYLHYVDGVKMHAHNSFPSGHSITIFVLATYVSYRYFPNKLWAQLIILFVAGMVAFSRVYLSQHFLHDTLAGGFIGILSVYLGLLISEKWQNRKLENSLLTK